MKNGTPNPKKKVPKKRASMPRLNLNKENNWSNNNNISKNKKSKRNSGKIGDFILNETANSKKGDGEKKLIQGSLKKYRKNLNGLNGNPNLDHPLSNDGWEKNPSKNLLQSFNDLRKKHHSPKSVPAIIIISIPLQQENDWDVFLKLVQVFITIFPYRDLHESRLQMSSNKIQSTITITIKNFVHIIHNDSFKDNFKKNFTSFFSNPIQFFENLIDEFNQYNNENTKTIIKLDRQFIIIKSSYDDIRNFLIKYEKNAYIDFNF